MQALRDVRDATATLAQQRPAGADPLGLRVDALGRFGHPAMTDVTERWRTERVMAAMYDAGVKHDRVAMVGAWAMWGADMRRMFADVARLADVPAGTSVLDIPCGGGFALRVLRPGQPVRYVAADISPHMLQRAREATRRMQAQDAIEFVEADVTALQFDDAQLRSVRDV